MGKKAFISRVEALKRRTEGGERCWNNSTTTCCAMPGKQGPGHLALAIQEQLSENLDADKQGERKETAPHGHLLPS